MIHVKIEQTYSRLNFSHLGKITYFRVNYSFQPCSDERVLESSTQMLKKIFNLTTFESKNYELEVKDVRSHVEHVEL